MLSKAPKVSQDLEGESLPKPLTYSNTSYTYNYNNYVSKIKFKQYLLHIYTYFYFLLS